VTQSRVESQGAGPCNIRGISIRRPEEPRSRTSPGRRQKRNHSFPWNSRSVRAQGHPECDRDELTGYVCLRPPRVVDSEMEEMVDSEMEEIMEVELSCKGLPDSSLLVELCGFLFRDEAIPGEVLQHCCCFCCSCWSCFCCDWLSSC